VTTGRIGLIGGTFDPPHLAHLVLASIARYELKLDEVLFVPAGDPYRKASRPVSPSASRLRMVEEAIDGLPWASVSSIEIDRGGPTFTVQTLENLQSRGRDWWFLLGADALADLPHWKDPAKIMELARFGLAQRSNAAAIPEAVVEALPGIRERIDLIEMPQLGVSSTKLRQLVRDGRPTDFLLPKRVRVVIDELGLYAS